MKPLNIKLSNKNILLVSGILTLILFFVLRVFDAPLHTEEAPGGIVSFELAKTIDKTELILLSWDSNAKISAGLSLGIDFLFLISYSIFIATSCLLVAYKYKDIKPIIYKIGITLAYLQFVAALFDAIENVALIKLLLGSQNAIYPSIAFYFATMKFLLIILAIVYILSSLIVLIFQKLFSR